MPLEVNTLDEPRGLAPDGFTLATETDIQAAGLAHLVRVRYPDEDGSFFEGIDGFRPRPPLSRPTV